MDKYTYTFSYSDADYQAIAEDQKWPDQVVGPDGSMILNPQTQKEFVQELIKTYFSNLGRISVVKAIEDKAAADKAALDATIQKQKDAIEADRLKALDTVQTQVDAKIDVVVEPLTTDPIIPA